MRKGQSSLRTAADTQLRKEQGLSLEQWVDHKLSRGVSWSRMAVDLERATDGIKVSRQSLASWFSEKAAA